MALYVALEPPAIADLSEEHRHYTGELLQSWEEGRVIVLMRHLERCDKYDLPCLTDKEGITARAKQVGIALREDFRELGLDKVVIYNSPLLRTAETESLVFDDAGEDRDWLVNCNKRFLDEALSNKLDGHNLILVTHSHCINRVQEVLGYADDDPNYGAVVFLSMTDTAERPKVLGFLDPEDWDGTLGY